MDIEGSGTVMVSVETETASNNRSLEKVFVVRSVIVNNVLADVAIWMKVNSFQVSASATAGEEDEEEPKSTLTAAAVPT